jgi:hypothetical protein
MDQPGAPLAAAIILAIAADVVIVAVVWLAKMGLGWVLSRQVGY